ncbi:MAG: molybdopterin-binding protein [Candidatus Moduliflexus flocculans]|nr:molybdopterin-binding protein [Candidatus Moduliflexus flocculans]
MKTEIIAVGSELLTPDFQDTNSLFLTAGLNAVGLDVAFKTIVGDDDRDLARVLRTALGRAGLVLCMGGLGPTEDDRTRETLARVLGPEARLRPGHPPRDPGAFPPPRLAHDRLEPQAVLCHRGRRGPGQSQRHRPGLWLADGRRRDRPLARPAARDPAHVRGPCPARGLAGLGRGLDGRRRVIRPHGPGRIGHGEPARGPSTRSVPRRGLRDDPGRARRPVHPPDLPGPGPAGSGGRGPRPPGAGDRPAASDPWIYSRDGAGPEPIVVGAAARGAGRPVACAESCTGGLLGHRLTGRRRELGLFPGVRGRLRQRGQGRGGWASRRRLIERHGAVSAAGGPGHGRGHPRGPRAPTSAWP